MASEVMGTSQSQRKTDDPFRSENLEDVTLFRSCAAGFLHARVSLLSRRLSIAQIGQCDWLFASSSGSPFEWRGLPEWPCGCSLENGTGEHARLPILALLRSSVRSHRCPLSETGRTRFAHVESFAF